MTVDPSGPNSGNETWRALLMGTDPRYARSRRILKHVPSEPRCKMCAAPFAGPGGPLMRVMGRGPWTRNPKYCGMCYRMMLERRGGAEVECSLLFADVRGSTTLAEGMRPVEYRALLQKFYETATSVLFANDGIVDKFVGDEVVALFVPAIAGTRHASRAIEAGRNLLRALAENPDTGTLPIGAGVETGIAFVGAIGDPPTDVTALGDVVNTAARMASAARAGEILVTLAALRAAQLPADALERRSLSLRGKATPTEVVVMRAA